METSVCHTLKSPVIKKFCESITELARTSRGYFEPIQDDFLKAYYQIVEKARINGRLPEGEYRQKGNAFRDFISELIYIRSGGIYRLTDRRIPGYSERTHDVDLAYVRDATVLVAGEVKMTGSPRHKKGTTVQKERKTQSDLDKRLKEVKFTAVDLKLRYTPEEAIINALNSKNTFSEVSNNSWWMRWIHTSIPGFYSFWASRLASGRLDKKTGRRVDFDNPDLLLEKFRNLLKYNNAVGLFMFREENGRYVPVETERIKRERISIDDAVKDLIKFLDTHLD
ncbi:hypothetical protein OCC_13281 [Thermococcus litoralis DSM 5473]|uniref:Restriction endonuclease n=3 Tax=Thermococcus litoralis TaxID=2265 RepID=H3ZRP1_THELN|nr:hypothetical protein [Thermococcus litoralis]ADZ31408.1 TliI [Thermococcus litoralis]EHR77447.1 hypothetical protein OCC_13281 [Thermococcus litoralis DSM 5473]